MDLLYPGEPGFIERRAYRRPACAHDATIRLRGRFAVAGRTADLTTVGARIDDAGPFPAGSMMWLRLAGLESQFGRVVWSQPQATGVSFDSPLHPAVVARFLPRDSRLELVEEAALPPQMPSEIAVLPRREQIVRGYGASEQGPLRQAKAPHGGGLGNAIRRTVARRAEHRGEEQFADGLRTGPMRLTVGERPAEVRNVSASGLRVAASGDLEVGSRVAVSFEGFPVMSGRVVWRRAGEIGLSLPEESLALDEA